MTKLIIIATLLFTVLLSAPSYADWTKLIADEEGDNLYLDFETIRKHEGYFYYWQLVDYLKPNNGNLSRREYKQGDCKLFRYKTLTHIWHKQSMGRDTGETYSPKNPNWWSPSKDLSEALFVWTSLKSVCSR